MKAGTQLDSPAGKGNRADGSLSTFGIIRQAARIDVWDLIYVYGNRHMFERMALLEPSGKPKAGYAARMASYVAHFGRCLASRPGARRSRFDAGDVLLFGTTANQRASLRPLLRVPSARLMGDEQDKSPVPFLPAAYGWSLLLLPRAIWSWLHAVGHHRQALPYVSDQYLLAYGYYVAGRRWLQAARPGAVVVASDHGMPSRALVLAARDEGVPSYYVQHASVTPQFPALAFDYALLEGYDALHAYDRAGASATTVFLIGAPKFDAYFPAINRKGRAGSVAICTNRLDQPDRVEEVCQALHERNSDLRRYLRPHPGDRRLGMWGEMAERNGMELSDPRREAAFEFLSHVDVAVAGNCNIHLEAALLDVFPIYYDFPGDREAANYSFITTGLCEYVAEPLVLCSRLRELALSKPSVRARARYYCATVGTEYDGRSAELAATLVAGLAGGQRPDMQGWQRVAGVALETYELVETGDAASASAPQEDCLRSSP